MRELIFHHVDVFTDVPLEGNALAVFPDARGLNGAEMQRIAREMNLSESTFVLPASSDGAVAALRIFTPAQELPFAGHPTIGTAFVLLQRGIVQRGSSFRFAEGVGLVPVRVDEGVGFMAWLKTPPISFGKRFENRNAIAAALGLGPADALGAAPPETVSGGNPFLYVPLRDEALVDAAALDMRAMRQAIGDVAIVGIYVFAMRPGGVYSRMFAPENGVIEDPATGSATGPLAAYLMEHGLVPRSDFLELTAEQGTHMGRRSILRIRVTGFGSEATIEVGGSAVALIEGTLRLP